MNNTDKTTVLAKICTINYVEGFDPAALAVDYIDMNTGETRKRLPVMAQMAWFRLKYPEGRFTLNVTAGKDCFVATARVYAHYLNPVDNYLSEATASRGPNPAKPSVSVREWAQTAALGIALRNAGFGLQFSTAGESFDEMAVNEFKQPASFNIKPVNESVAPPVVTPQAAAPSQPAEDPLETAMKVSCPLSKFKGKTLGDLISLDPGALVWIANKYSGDPVISAAAKLICEKSLSDAENQNR